MARRQTRRCLRVLRRRYKGRGTAPVLLKRRQFGERAHACGHVHQQHRAAQPHGRRTAGQGSDRDCAGGIHHAEQWRLDHVRGIPELTARDTGNHRLTLPPLISLAADTHRRSRANRRSNHQPGLSRRLSGQQNALVLVIVVSQNSRSTTASTVVGAFICGVSSGATSDLQRIIYKRRAS
jgi:hypothetical protein